MSNIRLYTFLLLQLCGSMVAFAQKSDWTATRCSQVDRNRSIANVTLGAGNAMLVGNARTIYQVQSCDLATAQPLAPGEQSVLNYRGGNTDLRWTDEEMKTAIKSSVNIQTAWYDEGADRLWIGTKSNGVFVLKAKPQLQLIDQITSSNSKLKSNQINIIFQDPSGTMWIGSEEGMLTGTPGKWKYEINGYGVLRARAFGNDVYVLADGEFWVVEGGSKWRAIVIDEKALEGEPRDFDVAPDGTLWVLSAMASAYNLQTDEFHFFSGIQDYTSEYGKCIVVDKEGEAWIGTDDKGLYHIGIPSGLAIICSIDQPVSCRGNGNDGALRVKVSGGAEPLTYKWSAPGMEGENPTQLMAGKYTVTVTDSKGISKSADVSLDDPRLKLEVKLLKPETGAGDANGNAEVVVSGGSPRYQYRWDNAETTNVARKLSEGTHTVTVTDAKGCSATTSLKMTQMVAELSVSIQEITPIKCIGGKTGVLQAVVQGGKSPYKFNWSTAATTESINSLTAGTYKVTITDSLGATVAGSFNIEPPAPFSAVALPKGPATANQSNGVATVQVQGAPVRTFTSGTTVKKRKPRLRLGQANTLLPLRIPTAVW
ncbi:MAG: hypothetical protein IPL65_05865 [Lewinellaceae bacterium]|nr:hypothetical protein [Lewinellaceae bacterium]